MNKNVTPIILLVLAIGIYFTFTKGKLDSLKSIQVENAGYQQALNNSEKLIKVRDDVLKAYNDISDDNHKKLDKMLPDNVDNVRLIIDMNGIGAIHNLYLKNIRTSATNMTTPGVTGAAANSNTGSAQTTAPMIKTNSTLPSSYETVTLTFNVTTDYQTFIDLLRDIQASLRIMDITKITLTANDSKNYDYGVELKTYWLKQ